MYISRPLDNATVRRTTAFIAGRMYSCS